MGVADCIWDSMCKRLQTQVVNREMLCWPGTGVLRGCGCRRRSRHFSGLGLMIGCGEYAFDGRDDQLAASELDYAFARQSVQRSGGGLARGADQAGQFTLRERDGILSGAGFRSEGACQLSHVVEDAIFHVAEAEELDFFFQLALARRQEYRYFPP